jgi:hypothetical protein
MKNNIASEGEQISEFDKEDLTFEGSDGTRYLIDPKHGLFPESPHQIGLNYVTEGVYFYGSKSQIAYEKNGRINFKGIGTEIGERTRSGRQPFMLIAEQSDGQAWIDVKAKLVPAEPRLVGGQVRDWAPFSPFKGMMDFETAHAIRSGQHLHRSSAREIINDVIHELNRRVELKLQELNTLAVQVLGTWVHRAFQSYPYGWFYGYMGSGKTTTLDVINGMAYHSILATSMSNSALFRLVHANHATVCYDEAESLNVFGGKESERQERISLFNSGYRAGSEVYLTEKDPDTGTWTQVAFDPYSPKFLASIKPISPTLQSRSLTYVMLKAQSDEKSKALPDHKMLKSIRQRAYSWLFAEGVQIKNLATNEKLTSELMKSYECKNREMELFLPLFLIADNYYPELLEDIADVLASQRLYQLDEASLSNEAIYLQVLYNLGLQGENAKADAKTFFSYAEWLDGIKAEAPDLKDITARTLGRFLKEIGLSVLKDHGTHNVKGVNLGTIDNVKESGIELLEGALKRMGILDRVTKTSNQGGKKIDQDYP